jgi:hypothetical protein
MISPLSRPNVVHLRASVHGGVGKGRGGAGRGQYHRKDRSGDQSGPAQTSTRFAPAKSPAAVKIIKKADVNKIHI